MDKNNYHEFKLKEEAQTWFHKNYEKFIKQNNNNCDIDNTLGKALFSYTGSMSPIYNGLLELNKGKLNGINEYIEKYIDKYIEIYFGLKINQLVHDTFAEDAKKEIRLIYNAFDYNKIPQNIFLYHYFNSYSFKEKMTKNKIIQLNRFISTTCLKNFEEIENIINQNGYDSLLKIRVNKGTTCIPIGNNPNSCLKEYEVILKPQSKIRIIKIKWHPLSRVKKEIECELL